MAASSASRQPSDASGSGASAAVGSGATTAGAHAAGGIAAAGAHAVSTVKKDSGTPLLEVTDLRKHFPQFTSTLIRRKSAPVRAVDGVTLTVHAGETVGLVGESGCGKSTAGRTLLRLIEPTSGTIRYQGEDVTHAGAGRLRELRREMQMVFQDPIGSLNPRHPVGAIIGAPYRIQGVEPQGGVKQAVQNVMERVGLNPEHYNRYPHEFSGGQRQRIGIARAVALQPKLIVCDEPVSALDVSIQAQVVNLLEDLQDEYGIAYVFIAHDLSVVRHISERVAVMYLGRMMELAPRDDLYAAPVHPYTQALMSAVPVPDPNRAATRDRILLVGDLPSPINPPSGCVFHTRCPKYRTELGESERELCRSVDPAFEEKLPQHWAACHYAAPKVDSAVVTDPRAAARIEALRVHNETPDLPSDVPPEDVRAVLDAGGTDQFAGVESPEIDGEPISSRRGAPDAAEQWTDERYREGPSALT